MALDVKLKLVVSEKCSRLTITDTTGLYDSVNNTTGWGSPNTARADIQSASLVITYANTTTSTIDVTSKYTSTAENVELYNEIDSSFEDGLTNVELQLTLLSSSLEFDCTFYILCGIRCCLDKLWGNFAENKLPSSIKDCICTEDELSNLLYLESLYSAMQAKILINKIDTSLDDTLKYIQSICKLENCKCNE